MIKLKNQFRIIYLCLIIFVGFLFIINNQKEQLKTYKTLLKSLND
ncbi:MULTISPECIES: SVM family protein [16SrI (Aster yellows group)]|uniref:Sequence-variable mosaic (SVM) signal sequence domain-containing protein n=1 Tax=New Jersey aster yellows phytoplasma TaxID=270520 RepID=A0ABX4K0P4_9MOLU|nr:MULTISPECIES: SVM family protein [16SrI (Aster yellows group)]PEH36365.1 hypothetical protein BBA70_00950 [New Jersey aster yellows phytoplasma]